MCSTENKMKKLWVNCIFCENGTIYGRYDEPHPCSSCGGTTNGLIPVEVSDDFDICEECSGEGCESCGHKKYIICNDCKGEGCATCDSFGFIIVCPECVGNSTFRFQCKQCKKNGFLTIDEWDNLIKKKETRGYKLGLRDRIKNKDKKKNETKI